MNLTKEIRKDLAAQLTAKAIEKHAPAMAKKVKTLNTKFTEVHARHLASLIPEVPEKSWDRMIQLHIVSPTGGGEMTVCSNGRDNEGKLSNSLEYLGALGVDHTFSDDVFSRLRSAMRGKWGKVLDNFDLRPRYEKLIYIYSFYPKFDRVMPAFDNFNRINLRALEPEHIKDVDQLEQARIRALAPLVKQVDELSAEFLSIITQALDYHDKVTDLLNSCRTDKQLENLFPEAAAMLPKPVKKAQPIVPVELAAQVRRMLADGVPA